MVKFYSFAFFAIITLFSSSVLQAQNVGIGTTTPQEKLDVNGAIKIGNTTNDFVGTIRYNPTLDEFEGRTNVGWGPLGGGTDDDWVIDGINMYSGVDGNAGIGISTPEAKLHVVTDSMFGIAGLSFNVDEGIGVVGIGNGMDPVIPGEGAGGAFIGHYGVFAYTEDTSGAGIYSWHGSGKYAGIFLGEMDFQGALRNSDDNLYGGSIAINDGVTIGNIAGASCSPVTDADAIFNKTMGGFVFFSGNSITHDNEYPANDSLGDCRKVTNLRYEVTFFDFDGFPIKVNLFVRNQYMGTIDIADAQVYDNPSIPSSFMGQDTASGGYYSHWFFNNNINTTWMGTDPDNTNWYVHCVNFGSDTDLWHAYNGIVSYKWGDSTSSPTYAAFGELRASGTLYANSTSAYGDVAEFFKVDKLYRKVEPGDIVSIAQNRHETFVISDRAYDPLIAGVISENPSVFLNDPKAGEPVALTGRVKVKVNTEGGVIKAGDPITSSSVAGVGMKAERSSIILGHALESFDGARTEQGKIWILLAKGHYEKVKDNNIETVKGDAEELRGIELNGAKKVLNAENEVMVKWAEKTNLEIPSDIEFEDLVIDFTPFGGTADLLVKNVNEDGFTVAIINRSENFKGFYYNVNLISPKFKIEEQNKIQQKSPENASVSTIADGKEILIAEHLEKVSGKSLKAMPAGMGVDEIKKYKLEILNSWKQASPLLYEQLMTSGLSW